MSIHVHELKFFKSASRGHRSEYIELNPKSMALKDFPQQYFVKNYPGACYVLNHSSPLGDNDDSEAGDIKNFNKPFLLRMQKC